MNTTTTTTASIYVGTYHKYNCGSIKGQWFDLADFNSAEEFYQAAAELHADEHDPELMFQDWEGIPSQFIGESHISPEFWEYLQAVEDSGLDPEVWAAADDLGIPWDKVEDCYYGYHETQADLAYEYCESCGLLESMPDNLRGYFDYESYGRDLAMDFSESGGHYFTNQF